MQIMSNKKKKKIGQKYVFRFQVEVRIYWFETYLSTLVVVDEIGKNVTQKTMTS